MVRGESAVTRIDEGVFAGKVAVVTGGANGIGRTMAERFAAAGMRVVLADVEPGPLAGAEQALAGTGAEVLAVVTDVSDAASVDALVRATTERFGTAHVVCSNAGVGGLSNFTWELPLGAWQWALGVNLMGAIHMTRTFGPILVEQDEGHMVFTASVAALAGGTSSAAYTASKHGVVGLAEQLRAELAHVGSRVRVSVLCPGRVETDIVNSLRNWPASFGPLPKARNADQAGALPIPPVMQEMFAAPMDVALVGDLVMEMLRGGQFWVLTHPDVAGALAGLRVAELAEALCPPGSSWPGVAEPQAGPPVAATSRTERG
jgi:NAD(P)-dependent dehydrogenase (short-subunit alcohol dehydrogenase family)